MHRYAVEDHQGRSTFLVEKQTIAHIAPADIRMVYEVISGSDVYANDQTLWILDLGDRLLIVPEHVHGLPLWLQTHQPGLVASHRWRQARCDMPPRAWRETWLGLIPRERVRLCTVPRVDLGLALPAWELLAAEQGEESEP